MTERVSPESVEALVTTLMNLIAGQAVSVSAGDFRKLTRDDITAFCSEGRLMMGNLAAASNCTIDTTTGTAVFTKNPTRPAAGVWTKFDGVGTLAKRSA
jgi:hypothetical protein